MNSPKENESILEENSNTGVNHSLFCEEQQKNIL